MGTPIGLTWTRLDPVFIYTWFPIEISHDNAICNQIDKFALERRLTYAVFSYTRMYIRAVEQCLTPKDFFLIIKYFWNVYMYDK